MSGQQRGLRIRPENKGDLGVVLLIDPEDYIRELICAVLAIEGYTVVDCDSAARAMTFIEKYPGKIDVLVAELVMQPMSGWDVSQAMKARQPQAKTVLYTGMYESSMKEWSHGEEVLRKPFTPKTLVARIAAVIEDRKGGQHAG